MTDPLKLAEEIEERLRREGGQYWPTFGPAEVRLIAAALRLAESVLYDEETDGQTLAEIDKFALAAYRAAREGR